MSETTAKAANNADGFPGLARLAEERTFGLREGDADRSARNRIERLLDPGSLLEVGLLARDTNHGRAPKTPTDGVIVGYGKVGGHRVGVVSQDAAVLAGSGGASGHAKVARVIQEAWDCRFPLVMFGSGGGGRIPDMMGSTFGRHGSISERPAAFMLARNDRPFTLIACCMGEMYGEPSFRMGLADFPVMVRSASFAVSGPGVVLAGIGERATGQELGGPAVQEPAGRVVRVEESEEELIDVVKGILGYTLNPRLPTTDAADRPTPEVETLLPRAYHRAYDVRKIIRTLVDQDSEPFYLWPNYGRSAVVCFARMQGRAVGVVASQPMVRGGVLDPAATRKLNKFVVQANRLGMPLIFLHDVPGFLIGTQAEREGILSEIMDYQRTLASVTVPRLSVILRKSYGLAYMAMAGPGFGVDYIAALPSARIAFMGAEPGINLVYAKKLAAMETDDERRVLEAELLEAWSQRAEPWDAAYAACLDDVIEPVNVRAVLNRALLALDR